MFSKMRKGLLALILAAAMILVPQMEAFAFSTSYVVKSDAVKSEKPADIFKDPYCFYKKKGLEIWGEKNCVVNLPMDGDAARDLLIINKSDNEIGISTTDDSIAISGKIKSYTENQLIVFHPNPYRMVLSPKESLRSVITVAFGNHLRNLQSNILNSQLTVKIKLSIQAITPSGERKKYNDVSISLPITANAYTTSYINAAKNRTAVIKGYVKDTNGKALANADVEIKGGFLDTFSVQTNSKGYYEAKVFGIKNGYSGQWHEYVVKVTKSGYADQAVVVYPQAKKSVSQSFTLKKASTKLSYTQTKKIDLGVQAYSFDANATGSVIAFIPFHSALPYEKLRNKMHLTVMTKTGKVLFQQKLPGETPYVDVSENGAYITTVQEIYENGDQLHAHSIPTIWNKSGKIVYSREYFPNTPEYPWAPMSMGSDTHTITTKCTKLSLDNKLLYIGTCDGVLYCIDWKTDKILWTSFLTNQIRTIDFSKDGSKIYATSGDGYLYCYNRKGARLWKSYIGSWGCSVQVGTKYIAVTSKCDVSGIRLLDANTGKQKWCYNTPARGSALVFSPDETMLWWGNDTCSAYSQASSVVIDAATGKVKFALDQGGQMADWTSDGKYLAVKTGKYLYVYNGKTGETLWSKEIVTDNGQNAYSISFSLYFSDDAKYITAVFNKDASERSWGQAYVFTRK